MSTDATSRPIRHGVLVLLAVASTAGSLLVGVAPGGWDLLGGVVVAFAAGYALLRRVIEARLTDPQAWALFALVGTAFAGVATLHARAEGGRPTGDLLGSYLVSLGVALVFGCRAIASR